jgi:hypothetical protein
MAQEPVEMLPYNPHFVDQQEQRHDLVEDVQHQQSHAPPIEAAQPAHYLEQHYPEEPPPLYTAYAQQPAPTLPSQLATNYQQPPAYPAYPAAIYPQQQTTTYLQQQPGPATANWVPQQPINVQQPSRVIYTSGNQQIRVINNPVN